jgi:hypothetical protein
MNFVNNWLTQLTAGLSVDGTTLPIPEASWASLADGDYLLTLCASLDPAEAAPVEIISVKIEYTFPTVLRGQEGTTARDWPTGSFIYCAITAGTANKLAALLGSPPGAAIRSPMTLGFQLVVSLENQSVFWQLVSGSSTPFEVVFPTTPMELAGFRLEILILNSAAQDQDCSLALGSAQVLNVTGAKLVATAASMTKYEMLGFSGLWLVVNRTV